MKKVLLMVAAALMAVAGFASFAAVESASADAAEELRGRGVLYARGSGLAVVEGDGCVEVRSYGVGTVAITGAERIEARGKGERSVRSDGTVVFAGFEGTILACGQDMTVRMEGRRIQFAAWGEGNAFLKGYGTFKLGGLSGRWTKDGVRLHFES